MTTEFTQFNLQPQLLQAVEACGYQAPMPIQSAIIPLMIAGNDVIGQAQPGTGKTAAYALPILNSIQSGVGYVQALILTPTRELALQVAKALGELNAHHNARVLAVYGGQAYGPQIGQLRRGVDIVVGTPGRIMDLMRKDVLDLRQVGTVVLDEADEMLSMGFIEDIETILGATPILRQTALFSATLPPEIRRLAERYMRDPQPVTIQAEQMTVEAIEQRAYIVNADDKVAALTRLFEVEDMGRALIFVRTRSATTELANALTARNFPAEALSGELNQDARERTLGRFRQNLIKVLVATDVAARGLDIEGITHVFNYDLPGEAEIYVHRIGRTGRAGKTGVAISLATPAERRKLRYIERFTRGKINLAIVPTEEEILKLRDERLTKQLLMWLQRGRCKHERTMVETMVEQGHDALDIAAAAIKLARAEEKQRPIFPVSELVETEPERPERRGRRDFRGREGDRARSGERPYQGERAPRRERDGAAPSSQSHENGMVRLRLSIGRTANIRPADLVGAIAAHANIPGNAIGKIYIERTHSLVDVPQEYVGRVLGGKVTVHRMPIEVSTAG